MKELGQRKANEATLTDEDRIRVSQLLDIAKARKSLAESKRVRHILRITILSDARHNIILTINNFRLWQAMIDYKDKMN